MSLKKIKEVCKYTDNNQEIICNFNGKRLHGLEKILILAKSQFQEIENINFFEFGSQEWNPSHYGPRSGVNAHFMGAGTNLSYQCFDAYSESKDFDANVELIDAYNKSEKQKSEIMGLRVKYDDPIFVQAKEKFESLSKNKDLSDNFIRIRNEEYFKKFYEFYENIDLDELKKEIQKFSVNDYNIINNMIKKSKCSVVYSTNVLNAPNLTNKYNFWNIENAFHIHTGSIQELAETLEIELGWTFLASKGKKFDMKEEFISSAINKFSLLNYDVKIQNDDSKYLLFWDASKKVEKRETPNLTSDQIEKEKIYGLPF
jgi:hypothetical protein